MWAIGQLSDLEQGYSIWSAEDFANLFWSDVDAPLNDDGGGGTTTYSSAADAGRRQSLEMGSAAEGGAGHEAKAAIATVSSREIIEKDREHLRTVFLLDQQQMTGGGSLSAGRNRSDNPNRSMNDDETIIDHDAKRPQQKVQENQQPPLGRSEKKKDNTLRTKRPDYFTKRIKQRQPRRKANKSHITVATDSDSVVPTTNPHPSLSSLTIQRKGQSHSNELRRSHSAPAVPSPTKLPLDQLLLNDSSSTENKPPFSTNGYSEQVSHKQLLSQHFPPLSKCIVRNISFPNLHTDEFFRVFFGDDAPYSMRDFQCKRGDVDVVYGAWAAVPPAAVASRTAATATSGEEDKERMCASFYGGEEYLTIPSNCVRERTMTFNTLTKR